MSNPSKDSARAHVLVVEDSSVFREMQELLLGQAGYVVSSHENPSTALEIAARKHFDLVVIDYELPGMNGEQFMHALRKIQPEIEVVFVSGALTEELVVRLGSQRLAGIFHKPTNPKTLLEKIDETLARHAARDTAARVGSGSPIGSPRRGNTSPPVGGAEAAANRLAYTPRFLLGSSDTFREFTHRVWKVRDFRAVLLLQGEAGSPFELIAREMAEISIFREGPIMVCDSARFETRGLIEVLAPSLLSHDAGTLLVTGVETFTVSQQKILDNLMTGRDVFLPFARRFRLILAATSELSERVDDGTFGETLFYKASALTLSVPALREMRGDIVENAAHILAMHREAGNTNIPVRVAQQAADWMQAQDWPGNYHELARTVLNAARFAHAEELTIEAISASWQTDAAPLAVPVVVSQAVPGSDVIGDRGGEARPPFPIASAIAPERALASAPAATNTVLPANGVGQLPAGQLFGRGAAPAAVRPLTAKSLFRPASSSYSFTKRLTESVGAAEVCAGH
jgi:DNA-binding NtrC family response regulator